MKRFWIILIGFILLFSIITFILLKVDWNVESSGNKCVDVGCGEDDNYVGSINSNKYYECDCHYAARINSENIVCFETKEQAEEDNRIWVEC